MNLGFLSICPVCTPDDPAYCKGHPPVAEAADPADDVTRALRAGYTERLSFARPTNGSDYRAVVTVSGEGVLTIAPDLTIDAAAEGFLDAVERAIGRRVTSLARPK